MANLEIESSYASSLDRQVRNTNMANRDLQMASQGHATHDIIMYQSPSLFSDRHQQTIDFLVQSLSPIQPIQFSSPPSSDFNLSRELSRELSRGIDIQYNTPPRLQRKQPLALTDAQRSIPPPLPTHGAIAGPSGVNVPVPDTRPTATSPAFVASPIAKASPQTKQRQRSS